MVVVASDLAIRTATSAVGAPRPSQPASSLSTEGLSFDQPALGWHDLPAAALKLAPDAGVVSEVVTQLSGARKLADGRLVQERIGYRATTGKLVLVTAERTLTRRPDGKLAPTGPWSLTQSETHTASAPVTRRTGTVSPGVLHTATSSTAAGPGPSRAHASGVDSEAWLPSSVRAGLVKTVPTPSVHIGAFLLWTLGVGGGEPIVDVLRLGGDRGVVVRAVRPDRPDADWRVSQLTYDLEPQALRIGR